MQKTEDIQMSSNSISLSKNFLGVLCSLYCDQLWPWLWPWHPLWPWPIIKPTLNFRQKHVRVQYRAKLLTVPVIELAEPCISNGLLGIAAPGVLHNRKREGNFILGKKPFILSPFYENQPSSVRKLLPA